MPDLSQYESLGAVLRDSLEHWADHICLIEADRDRENCRLTYREFRKAALPLAAGLQESGFSAGDRAAIIMTNQSKWLISAYSVFYSGGVLVPLDSKLSAAEHLQLLSHSGARFLIVEYHLWRAILQALGSRTLGTKTVLVTEAPAKAPLGEARRWEETAVPREPIFVQRRRTDPACIVYSSGTGGRPKGCVLTHANYLDQCSALTSIYPFWPGVRYLSIIPTNHALDFMVGFIGAFVCGATVVHLRTLRPEFIREAFVRYQITHMTVVPMILKNLQTALQERFAALPPHRRAILNGLIAINRVLTRRQPNPKLSRLLLRDVHKPFGGELLALFVGGAFTDPATLQFFYDLGIPVAQGYGLTEACTVVSVNDLGPFRADTVGKPLAGTEIKIVDPDREGVGEVAVRGNTVMSHYLDDPEMTGETIIGGWLMTGDLGRIDSTGHLQLVGRKKNMIVTQGGKNVYPEDVEAAFESLPVKEFCVFASRYVWPGASLNDSAAEQLILILRFEEGHSFSNGLRQEIAARNQRLPDFKRVSGVVVWADEFPRTASLKIKRGVLAEQVGKRLDRASAVVVV